MKLNTKDDALACLEGWNGRQGFIPDKQFKKESKFGMGKRLR